MASIRRRKDRQSGWIVDCRDVPGGRRLTVATREQAEFLRAKMIQESQQAAPSLQDRDIKVDTYAERWLEQIASSVDARTLASYRENLRLYIRPVFGNIMVRAIQPSIIPRRYRREDVTARHLSVWRSRSYGTTMAPRRPA